MPSQCSEIASFRWSFFYAPHACAFVDRHRAIWCLVRHRSERLPVLPRFHYVRPYGVAGWRPEEQISRISLSPHRGGVCARIAETQEAISSSKLGGCLPDGSGQHHTKYRGILMFGTVRRSLVFGQALGPTYSSSTILLRARKLV